VGRGLRTRSCAAGRLGSRRTIISGSQRDSPSITTLIAPIPTVTAIRNGSMGSHVNSQIRRTAFRKAAMPQAIVSTFSDS